MDAFKELMRLSPSLEVATLEELRTISIFSKTAAAYGRHLIEAAAKFPDRLGPQSAKWLEDSQRAMEVHIFTEAERGKRAKEEPQVQAPQKIAVGMGGKGAVSSGESPKWKRLGFDSEKEMVTAEFLDSHRGEAKRVIAEAKDSKDVPSKGAIKQAVATSRAEERAKRAEKEAASLRSKGEEKAVREHPKVVKEYLDSARSYRDTLKLAIASRLRGMFSPESGGFVKRLHDEIRRLMERLEE